MATRTNRESNYWRILAEEARALAEYMSPENRAKMMEVAETYAGLAQQEVDGSTQPQMRTGRVRGKPPLLH